MKRAARLAPLVFAIVAVVAPAGAVRAQETPDCSPLERQLDRDKQALARQQQSILEGERALDEWTKANERAQEDALKQGIKLFADAAARKLEQAAAAARTFDEFFRTNNVPLVLLSHADARAKVQRAYDAYARAGAAMRTASVLKSGTLATDVWDLFKNEIAAVVRIESAADASLRQVANDRDLAEYLKSDDRGSVVLSEALSALVALGAQSSTATKLFGTVLDPATSLASFLVDYGYDATAWYQSRQRILQEAHASDVQLVAVAALTVQIQRTVGKLQACRRQPAAAQKVKRPAAAGAPSQPGVQIVEPGTDLSQVNVDGNCTTAAFNAAMQQQNALLARGDPQSVQAAGAVSHGGRGPTYYVPILGPCGSGQPHSSTVPFQQPTPSRSTSVPAAATTATHPPASRASAAPSKPSTASPKIPAAAPKPAARATPAPVVPADELVGTWIIEAGTANVSGTVNGQRVTRQIPRLQSRLSIARIGNGVYRWTESGMAQSIKTTIRRLPSGSFAGPLSAAGLPMLPGVTTQGTISFRLQGKTLTGDTRETASGAAGSVLLHSAWRAHRIG